MSLTLDGRAAFKAMLDAETVFRGIRPRDWSSAAVKLAKRALFAGGQDRNDILAIRSALGEDIFEKALDSLSAHHMKQLARRVDPGVDAETIATGASALAHIRAVLKPDWHPAIASQPEDAPAEIAADAAPEDKPAEKKSNPYIGRKAFRMGR